MLKGLKDILKTMGKALTVADAGEMLTGPQKLEVLARNNGGALHAPDAGLPRVVLAADEVFDPTGVEHAIALCREHNAMLDLLYVSPEGRTADSLLPSVLPQLVAETNLDFRITRRHGDLLAVTETYLRGRTDTLATVLNVSQRLRKRLERCGSVGTAL